MSGYTFNAATFNLRDEAAKFDVPMAPKNSIPEIFWVDVETTGIDPSVDMILEVGMLATTAGGGIIEGSMFHALSYCDAKNVRLSVDDFIKHLHDNSGLWDDMEAMDPADLMEAFQIDAEIVDYFAKYNVPAGMLPMAGSSVHFDRKFFSRFLPQAEETFHYRNIDISTLKGLAALLNPSIDAATLNPRKLHRSIPDLIDTIAEYRYYIDNFLVVGL